MKEFDNWLSMGKISEEMISKGLKMKLQDMTKEQIIEKYLFSIKQSGGYASQLVQQKEELDLLRKQVENSKDIIQRRTEKMDRLANKLSETSRKYDAVHKFAENLNKQRIEDKKIVEEIRSGQRDIDELFPGVFVFFQELLFWKITAFSLMIVLTIPIIANII